MKLEMITSEILEELMDVPVIDAHQHLMTEEERVSRRVDFFLLFSHYCRADLCSAGMEPAVYDRLRNDQDMPVEEKWKEFSPFYPMIKYGSYAKPALIWLREVLGYDDLTEQNYQEVSTRLQESNRKGLYNRILREMCHIEAALVVPDDYEKYDFDLLKPLWPGIPYASIGRIHQFVKVSSGKETKGIVEYLDMMEEDLQRYLKRGRIGIKTICFPFEEPDTKKANDIFRSIQLGKETTLSPAHWATLSSVIYDRIFQLAEKHGLTVAVHSGVWGDFRDSQPTYLIPIAMRYPNVSFDLFHLGMPFVREGVMIGKMFPNVSLNFCWTTVVSPELTVRMLDECVDLVPMNNIIVFGGDYNLPVEKNYGHLKMTKEVVARVLAKRIKMQEMSRDEALSIARMWFYDNPKGIYRL